MKVQTLIVFLLGAIPLCAQIIDCDQSTCAEVEIPTDDSGNYLFQQVIEVPGKTAAELYSQSKVYFAEQFKSANDVVQSEDPNTHTIIGKAWSAIDLGIAQAKLWYTLKIETKDGRYRYSIYAMRYDASNAQIVYEEPLEQAFFEQRLAKGKRNFKDQKIRTRWLETVNALQKALISKMAAASSAENNEW